MNKKLQLALLTICFAVFTFSCEKSHVNSEKSPTMNNATACDCISSYSDLKYTEQKGEFFVDITTNADGTTLYFHLYRLDNVNVGNLFLDYSSESKGGSNTQEYRFEKSVSSCNEVTTHFKIVGAQQQPVEFDIYYTLPPLCPPPVVECSNFQNESAFGGNNNGPRLKNDKGKEIGAWWYYYTGGTQRIYAGQSIDIGYVTITGSHFDIVLEGGWKLQPGGESVKIQAYNDVPSESPSVGLFTSYKGSSLSDDLSSTGSLYVIHLDVRRCNQ